MKTLFYKITSTAFSMDRINISLLIYRILISVSLIHTHGLKKVLNIEETILHVPDPFGIGSELSAYFAILSSFFFPIFVAIGLLSRLAVIPIILTTLIGLFIIHKNDPWSVKDVPLMYTIAFSLILVLGPGKFSFDYKLFKQNS